MYAYERHCFSSHKVTHKAITFQPPFKYTNILIVIIIVSHLFYAVFIVTVIVTVIVVVVVIVIVTLHYHSV